jgi:thiamine thiazole synthase
LPENGTTSHSHRFTKSHFSGLHAYAESDIVIVGAGSCGLNTADILAKAQPNLNIAIVEASAPHGGGCWLGGRLFSAMGLREPADALVSDIGVPFEDDGNIVAAKHAALFLPTLMRQVLAMPNVKPFNATCVEDLITPPAGRDAVRIIIVVTGRTLVTLHHDSHLCTGSTVDILLFRNTSRMR